MEKPRLSFWQIWNMSFGFLGIQFGWGLQMANMSAIYEYLGAKPDEIPMLWLAASFFVRYAITCAKAKAPFWAASLTFLVAVAVHLLAF